MQGQLPCDVLTPSRKWSWSLLSLSLFLSPSLTHCPIDATSWNGFETAWKGTGTQWRSPRGNRLSQGHAIIVHTNFHDSNNNKKWRNTINNEERGWRRRRRRGRRRRIKRRRKSVEGARRKKKERKENEKAGKTAGKRLASTSTVAYSIRHDIIIV